MRIYLAGRLMIEAETGLLDEESFPSRQGRIAFAYLMLNRHRPVPRQELVSAIWEDDPPDAEDVSLSAILSRLRRLFRNSAVDLDIATVSGSVGLSLPSDFWVDVDAARNALDEAEGFLRSNKPAEAWPLALVAYSITERGFLAGEEQAWVIRERDRIRGDHLTTLECLSDITLLMGELTAAARFARQCTDIEPFRESAYEREIRAEMKMGNRAEALRTYERLRAQLSRELGTDPSPALQAAFLEVLRD